MFCPLCTNYKEAQLHCTYNLLSINNVELSITNGETAPPHHPVCRCDTTPEDEQLKDKDHAWTNVWSGRTHCKHALVNLNRENMNKNYSQSRSRVNSNSKNEMNIRISLCNVRRVNEMLDISLEIVPKKMH